MDRISMLTDDGAVAQTCEKCGAWVIPERDKDGCHNCRVIAQRAEEREAAARNLIQILHGHGSNMHVSQSWALQFADALDHYIARSSQGWCR